MEIGGKVASTDGEMQQSNDEAHMSSNTGRFAYLAADTNSDLEMAEGQSGDEFASCSAADDSMNV